MRIIDISQTLEDMMVYYPSLTKFELKWKRSYKSGDNGSLSEITMASHIGTHVDSSYHFIKNGRKLDEIDLEVFYGPVRVIEIPKDMNKVEAECLKEYGELSERILFKTKNSELLKQKNFVKDYVYIDKKAAEYIAERNVRLVGIDYFSVDKYKSPDKETHKILLSKNIVLLEGINLNGISEGNYQLICFPLKIKGAEGAPCRAVLIEN